MFWSLGFIDAFMARIDPDNSLHGSFWMGNVGWVTFDHGVT